MVLKPPQIWLAPIIAVIILAIMYSIPRTVTYTAEEKMPVAIQSHIIDDRFSRTSEIGYTRRVVPLEIKERLIAHFGENHPLINVARCESTFRQFDKDGNPLRGRENNLDVGLFQINLRYWEEPAKKLGYDLNSVDGNMKMAEYIFSKTPNGINAWNWSRKCWGSDAS